MSGTWLVIPSNRMDSLREFFQAWDGRGGWDMAVVVEDAPQRSNNSCLPYDCFHYSHKEIAEVLGDAAWIISRKDSACRCFGFLVAWWGGADRVLTLDDDVRPDGDCENFAARHMEAMKHPKWMSSLFGMRVRGIPYKNPGELADVVANVGLWTNHPDLDAVTQLGYGAQEVFDSGNPPHIYPRCNWIVPHGQFAPVCGMNLMLDRKVLPLSYFPLMGEGQPFARMDDIWAGIILKHCCDALGWHVSVGKPFVDHQKASDPFVNLVKEAPGIGANERFWQRIAAVDVRREMDAFHCMERIGLHVAGWKDEHEAYWSRLGKAVQRWVNLFRTKPKGL